MCRDVENMVYVRDWKKTLRSPHVYRVAKYLTTSTFRIQSQYLALMFLLLSVPLFLFGFSSLRGIVHSLPSNQFLTQCRHYKYNKTYPLSAPIKTSKGITYRIAIVSDLDRDSKNLDKKNVWHSIMKTGSLFWTPITNFIFIIWDDRSQMLTSSLTMKGRGMELSELVTFDGHLLSFDDRTGAIYFIEGEEAYPWVILMDGNGKNSKGKLHLIILI